MRNKLFFKIKKQGFTLIELLIVIAVMAILTTVVFVALNPLARFQDARNSRRWNDVNAILSAVKLQQVDNGGAYLDAITDNLVGSEDVAVQIGTGSACDDTCSVVVSGETSDVTLGADCLDLADLVEDGYLPNIPIDPNADGATQAETRYYFILGSNGTITVGSCNEEEGSGDAAPMITVSR